MSDARKVARPIVTVRPFTPSNLAPLVRPVQISAARGSRSAADDGQLLIDLARVMNNTVEFIGPMRSGSRAEFAVALGRKAVGLGAVGASAGAGGEALRGATFAGSQFFSSLGMGLSVAKMGARPVAATITIGLETANKVIGTMGYAGFDRCQVALAGLATTSGLAVAGSVGTLGLGTVVGVAAVALQAAETWNACREREPTGRSAEHPVMTPL